MPGSAECKINTPKSTDCREFFYNERIARIWLIFFSFYCAVWIVLMVLGVIRPLQATFHLLALAIYPTSYAVWVICLGRRYPIFAVSEQLVEWRQSDSRKRSSIPSPDIIHAEKVATHVVVLRTTSKGSVRIPLVGLSPEDRQEIKKLTESVSGRRVGSTVGQDNHTHYAPASEGLAQTNTDRDIARKLALRIQHTPHLYEPGPEYPPPTNTDRDIELEADFPNSRWYAPTWSFFNLPDRVGGKSRILESQSVDCCVKVTIPYQLGRTQEFAQRCVPKGEGCGL